MKIKEPKINNIIRRYDSLVAPVLILFILVASAILLILLDSTVEFEASCKATNLTTHDFEEINITNGELSCEIKGDVPSWFLAKLKK